MEVILSGFGHEFRCMGEWGSGPIMENKTENAVETEIENDLSPLKRVDLHNYPFSILPISIYLIIVSPPLPIKH